MHYYVLQIYVNKNAQKSPKCRNQAFHSADTKSPVNEAMLLAPLFAE